MIALLIAFVTHWLVKYLVTLLGGWVLRVLWRRLIVPRLLGLLPTLAEGLFKSLLHLIAR